MTVDGAPAHKPSRLVAPHQALALLGPPPTFVSRGGLKLEAALRRFSIDVDGLRVVDVGASTGGFTDCCLQRGATHVLALDVGRGQLHRRIELDERVTSMERTNVRHVVPEAVGAPFDLLVADLSFISLRTVAPALLGLVAPGAPMVLLVKPQFEAGREAVRRGRGVITEPEVWQEALDGVVGTFAHAGAAIIGAMASPIHGADGNVEFLVALRAPGAADAAAVDPAAAIGAALAEATAPEIGRPS